MVQGLTPHSEQANSMEGLQDFWKLFHASRHYYVNIERRSLQHLKSTECRATNCAGAQSRTTIELQHGRQNVGKVE